MSRSVGLMGSSQPPALFRAAAGQGEHEVDDATWQRAEAWALHFAVVYTLHSADNPTMGAIGEQLRTTLLA